MQCDTNNDFILPFIINYKRNRPINPYQKLLFLSCSKVRNHRNSEPSEPIFSESKKIWKIYSRHHCRLKRVNGFPLTQSHAGNANKRSWQGRNSFVEKPHLIFDVSGWCCFNDGSDCGPGRVKRKTTMCSLFSDTVEKKVKDEGVNTGYFHKTLSHRLWD